MKRGQGSLEYLLILAAILAIGVVVVLVANSMLATPSGAAALQEDKYKLATQGFEVKGYDEAFTPGESDSLPDSLKKGDYDYFFSGDTDLPDDSILIGSLTDSSGGSHSVYTSDSTGSYYVPTGGGSGGDDECSDECETSESPDCIDDDGYRTCADHDDDGCREWGSLVYCDDGEVCSDGECIEDEGGGGCETDENCLEDEICSDGECVGCTECIESGYVWVSYDGTVGCDDENGDCAEYGPEFCNLDGECWDAVTGCGQSNGYCLDLMACETNSDCSEGAVCYEGTCIEP
ncbi:class III signal peptide-containing protein [archaeon]